MRRTPRVMLLIFMAAGAACAGCWPAAMPRPGRVVYRFENVRTSDGVDEWDRIRQIVKSHADGDVAERTTRSASFAGQEFRDYELTFEVYSLRDLIDIQRDLSRLSADSGDEAEINFRLTEADLVYRSNFVAAGTEIAIHGVTAPYALVRLRVGSQSYDVRADANGFWRQPLPTASHKPFVYGYSEDRQSKVRRYFRINLLSQSEQAITEDTFRSLYPRDGG